MYLRGFVLARIVSKLAKFFIEKSIQLADVVINNYNRLKRYN